MNKFFKYLVKKIKAIFNLETKKSEIKKKTRKPKNRMYMKYTKRELKYIENNFKTMSDIEIAKKLKRTRKAIAICRQMRGLYKYQRTKQNVDYSKKEVKQKITAQELAGKLNVTYCTARKYANSYLELIPKTCPREFYITDKLIEKIRKKIHYGKEIQAKIISQKRKQKRS